jgi:hypothetical protein
MRGLTLNETAFFDTRDLVRFPAAVTLSVTPTSA